MIAATWNLGISYNNMRIWWPMELTRLQSLCQSADQVYRLCDEGDFVGANGVCSAFLAFVAHKLTVRKFDWRDFAPR